MNETGSKIFFRDREQCIKQISDRHQKQPRRCDRLGANNLISFIFLLHLMEKIYASFLRTLFPISIHPVSSDAFFLSLSEEKAITAAVTPEN